MAAYIPARTKVISEKQRLHRIGAAMTQNFPWDGIMSNQAKTWIQTVAGAHNTKAEYVFLSSLAAIAALAGPQTRVTIHEHTYEEKLNTFMCILGDAGANKSGAFRLALNTVGQVPNDCTLRGNWSKAGLMAHLIENHGSCLLLYEEMDSFFASICKGQKNNEGDRALFCELYDGESRQIVRSSSDFKTQVHGTPSEVSMNICGYMQPDPFLLDYYDLCSRRDGFLDRFHISCPNSRLLTLEEVEKNVETLNRYGPQLRSFANIYKITDVVHSSSGIHYRLSKDARNVYKEMAEEEINTFNSIIEQRIEFAASSQQAEYRESSLMSKTSRSSVKLAGILHIFLTAFDRLQQGKEYDASPFPEEIAAATFKGGHALAEYFSQQKEILFARLQDQDEEEDAVERGASRVFTKVLSMEGKFVTCRQVANKFNARCRPSTGEIEQGFIRLAAEGFGYYNKDEGAVFYKYENLPKNADKYDIIKEEYLRAYNSPSKGLSKKQIEEFEEKHTALISTSVCEAKPIPPKPDTNAANTS